MNQLFDPAAWAAFGSPTTWRFLLGGLRTTLLLAVGVLVIGLVLACGAALARISRRRRVRVPAELVVGLLRSLPVPVILVSVFFLAPVVGLDLPAFPSALVALSAYMAAVLSDVLVAGLRSLERGQWEAAAALGLSPRTRMALVIGPQALRRMTPGIVGVLITAVKDTSLASILTVDELLGRANQVQSIHLNPLQTYLVIGLVYLAVNLGLARLSRRLEADPAGSVSVTATRGAAAPL